MMCKEKTVVMKQIDKNELKKIQVDILCFVDDFCRTNGINYWIDCGTLLGAVRHGGYIPWDDDIDIGMLRDDYEKFMRTFPGASPRYIFLSAELNEDYYIPFGKVIDGDTVLYEPDRNGYKIAVYIDVFVYDNAPDDDSEISRMYDKRDCLRRLNHARTGYHRKTQSAVKELAVMLGSVILKPFPKRYFVEKMIELCKKYDQIETHRVGNFAAEARMCCSKDVFADFTNVTFEGKQFRAPAGYREWLTAFYGDYMKLPPPDKRESHHEFEAYYVDSIS